MKTTLSALATVAAISICAPAANAASIVTAAANCDSTAALSDLDGRYADYSYFTCGGTGREDVGAVNIGEADGNFFSLGLAEPIESFAFGASAAFEIDPSFTGGSSIVEVTFSGTNHWEAAGVYVANSISDLFDAMFADDNVGIVNNGKGGSETATTSVTFSGVWSWIGFVDKSHEVYGVEGNGTRDGFDLDAFTIVPVPLPAGGLLLLTALGGLAAARRKRKAA